MSTIIQNLRCLNPKLRCEANTFEMMSKLLNNVPQVIPPGLSTDILDEWRLYMVIEVPAEWYTTPDGSSKSIDEYWNNVFQCNDDSGGKKFKLLPVVVKALMCLAHGNADPERGFSVNKRIFSSDRSLLSEASINGLRTVEDIVRRSGGVTSVLITNATLKAVRNAGSLYRERIQAEKNLAERTAEQLKQIKELQDGKNDAAEQTKADLEKIQKALMDEDKEVHDSITTAELMIDNANDSLKQAIKAKDMRKAELAQALIAAAQKKLVNAKSNARKRTSVSQSLVKHAIELQSTTKVKKTSTCKEAASSSSTGQNSVNTRIDSKHKKIDSSNKQNHQSVVSKLANKNPKDTVKRRQQLEPTVSKCIKQPRLSDKPDCN